LVRLAGGRCVGQKIRKGRGRSDVGGRKEQLERFFEAQRGCSGGGGGGGVQEGIKWVRACGLGGRGGFDKHKTHYGNVEKKKNVQDQQLTANTNADSEKRTGKIEVAVQTKNKVDTRENRGSA